MLKNQVTKKTTLSTKKAEKQKNGFLPKNNGRFRDLFFSKLFHLPMFFTINRNFFLKTNSEKLMRFTVENHGRFKNLNFLKVFKMRAEIDKNENFCFIVKKPNRFIILKKIKKINLPAKNAEKLNSFFISSFKKFLRFSPKIPRRFVFLNFSKVFNLPLKKRKNRNFSFLLKKAGRLGSFEFLKSGNLRAKVTINRKFCIIK